MEIKIVFLMCVCLQVFFFVGYSGLLLFKKPIQEWVGRAGYLNYFSIIVRQSRYKVISRVLIAYFISMVPIAVFSQFLSMEPWVFGGVYVTITGTLFLLAIPAFVITGLLARKEKWWSGAYGGRR